MFFYASIQFIEALYGGDAIHIKYIEKRQEYYESFKALEVTTGAPVNPSSEEFKRLGTEWVFGPGIHVLVDKNTHDIISIIRVE